MIHHDCLQRFLEDFFYRRWIARIDGCFYRAVESKLLLEAADEIGVESSTKILDVGCGDGHFTGNLFDREDVTGIDVLESGIAKARRFPVFRRLLCEDITRRTTLGSEFFDFTFSNCVLEHVHGLDGALDEIARTLKPGGWLFLSVPSPCFARHTILGNLVRHISPSTAEKRSEKINAGYDHVNLLPPSTWRRMLGERGFDEIRMMKMFDHREILIWDFFRYYIPTKLLRILAAIVGANLAMRLVLPVTRPVYDRYTLRMLGDVTDECTHNGLIMLCRKRMGG